MANTSTTNGLGTLHHECRFFVYYEDTDFSGFVYHANYLKFFERAREHLIGIEYIRDSFQRDGVHFVVAKAQVDFQRPGRHGDELRIVTRCHYGRSPSLVFEQEAWRNAELLVKAEIQAVCLNREHRPIRLPETVQKYFAQRRFDNPS